MKTNHVKGDRWVMACLFLFSISLAIMCSAVPKETFYEVEVKVNLGQCYTYKKVVVKARSVFDAKEQAESVARYSVKTSVRSYKELK